MKAEHCTTVPQMQYYNFALMDIEYIQVSKTHQCIRKLCMLAKDGFTNLRSDFYPCTRYRDIERKYQRTFHYCQNHIHNLRYDPRYYSPECKMVSQIVKNFIYKNSINLILYKGGTIEKCLCEKLCIPSYNIECLPGIEKANCHDPEEEVCFYFNQLVELGYI